MEHEEGKDEIGTEILRIREIHVVVREVLREDTRQGNTDRDRLPSEEGGYTVRILSRHDKSVGLSFCLREW